MAKPGNPPPKSPPRSKDIASKESKPEKGVPAPKAAQTKLPPELLALQKKEAELRKQAPPPKKAKAPGPPVHQISVDDIKKFVRGEITLAQLEGLSREQLYDFAEIGYTMFKSGKLEEAAKVFEGLVTYNPYDAYFHSALGAIYQKKKRFDDAIRQYDLAIKFNPKDTCSHTNRGETFLLLGRLEEAQKDFQKAIELDPEQKDPWATRSRALIIAVKGALEKKHPG